VTRYIKAVSLRDKQLQAHHSEEDYLLSNFTDLLTGDDGERRLVLQLGFLS